MTDNLYNFSDVEMERLISQQMEKILFRKRKKKDSQDSEIARLFKEKITDAKSPEILVRSLITSVLEKEFGPQLASQPYYERMVASIAGALISNGEVKNRLVKLILKYLDSPDGKKSS